MNKWDENREDGYRTQGLRKALIKELREKGITDERVLDGMMAVPRHYFFDPEFDSIAYEDRAFPIAANQTISQPYTVAFQTSLLSIKPGERVLEIGTGSGYQSAVLVEMGAYVITIERQHELFLELNRLPYISKIPKSRLKRFFGDGFIGSPSFAPFDKIIITCGAPIVPPKLIEQLKTGGCIVIPLAEDEHHKMLRLTKNEDGSYETETFKNFSFVPMLPGTQSL
jgi:protein-L-isoaspartate(D-aspartate) O-methyltransferase